MPESDWVTVETGPPWELDLLAGILDEQSIPTYRPDDMQVALDPLVHSTGTSLQRLQVHEADVARATRLLAARRRAPAAADDDEDGEYALTGQEEVEYVARWVRFASWSVVGLVLVPWLLAAYRRACREHGTRSRQHAATVAAPWIGLAVLAVVVLAFVFVPRWIPTKPLRPGQPPPPPPPPVPQPPILPGQ